MPDTQTPHMDEKIFYTSDELLEIFKEQHRLCSPLDCMADETYELKRHTLIYEWRDAQDLLPWDELAKFLNQEFRIEVSLSIWKNILNPDDKQTLGDVCDFLSTVAQKEIIIPVKRLGAECLSAAIFLTLKRNLKSKGADVSELRPSTEIAEFLNSNKNFSPLMEEVTLLGVKTFEKIKSGKLETDRRYKYWIDKIFPNLVFRRPINTGEINTFRDLIDKIMENDKLGITRV
jgi:hypothetical protein